MIKDSIDLNSLQNVRKKERKKNMIILRFSLISSFNKEEIFDELI